MGEIERSATELKAAQGNLREKRGSLSAIYPAWQPPEGGIDDEDRREGNGEG